MNGAPYRHIGGMVVADHGPLSLTAARALEAFYRVEACHRRSREGLTASRICDFRADVLAEAAAAAEAWRRAAGWTRPEAADR